MAARASTQRPSRSAIRRTAPSKCNSTEKHFRALRSRAWKRSLLPLSCAAASRAAPSEGLRRTNRIPASLPCSLSSAEFPRALFRRSRGFPGIWAHPPAVRHSMKLYETLRSNRVTIAGRFSWLRLALAFSSAVAGLLLTKMENRKWKFEERNSKLETRNSKLETRNSKKLPLRSGTRPSREADVHCRDNATLQRRPARVDDDVAA